MRENIIQKRKISAAICEEWLERDKVLSGRQKDAIRQYVRMHTDKPEELYQIYHAMIRGENYKAETLEVLMEEGQPILKIGGNEIRAALGQMKDFVQKMILITEKYFLWGVLWRLMYGNWNWKQKSRYQVLKQ